MNAPLSPAPDAPVLVVSAPLAAAQPPEGVTLMALDRWRATLIPLGGAGSGSGGLPGLALGDMTVLGLCLAEADAEAVAGDPALSALLDAAAIPLRRLPPQAGAAALAAAALALLLDRHRAVLRQGAADRAALAALRSAHMQMQTDHAELESWVWDALAPKHKLVRAWPATADTATLAAGDAPLRQPLPVPARGFAAVDVHLAASAPAGARLRMTLVRPVGPDFEDAATEIDLPEGHAGWLRLTLPRAPGGAPEDAEVALAATGDGALQLSLAPESPFADVCARSGDRALARPLALRVYRTLPRMPAPPLHDTRRPLPADGVTRLIRPSDLGPPEQLPYWARRVRRGLRAYPDFTAVEHWTDEDAHFVHPSAHRPVVARVPGLSAEALVQLRGIVQIGRHDTMEVAFAIGAAPAGTVGSAEQALGHLGPWVHLLPAEWGEVWYEPPAALSGPVDLLLATAMPNMPFNRNADALFHGYRLTSRAGGAA
ncbi:DUF6212 domain-containing protein [Halovulum marinum]|uniref:DUF6212 domain-containing protein n=1 Tax=Halovulum marinum TaxID=2662447 RepID=UPI001F2E723E|nr:DUF6212 domain-containing protein [Halovulum marinum]